MNWDEQIKPGLVGLGVLASIVAALHVIGSVCLRVGLCEPNATPHVLEPFAFGFAVVGGTFVFAILGIFMFSISIVIGEMITDTAPAKRLGDWVDHYKGDK